MILEPILYYTLHTIFAPEDQDAFKIAVFLLPICLRKNLFKNC